MSTYQRWTGLGALAAMSLIMGCGGTGGDTGAGSADDEIIRVSRQNNSGTYVYFRETVLGEDREFKLGSIDQSGSKDVVELVSTTPNAIGYSGMGYATDDVKMLNVSQDGGAAIAPTSENAASGLYPLARALYVYTAGEPTGALKHFIQWCRSADGEAIVTEIGYVALTPIAMDDPAPEGGPHTIKVAGSDTMVNLSQAWAEAYMAKFENVNVQVSGGGSGTGIKSLIDGTVDLANASRDMKDEEKKLVAAQGKGDAMEFTMALDALAVYVHKDNPITEISLKELAEIYGDGSTTTHWSQLGAK